MDGHRALYDVMSAIMESVVEKKNLSAWKDVKPSKYKGNRREAEIIHINLCDILKSSEDTRLEWIPTVRQITVEFLAKMKKRI